MKKLFMMAAVVMALIFAGCDQPADSSNGDNTPKLTLTIKNQSSYPLPDVQWLGKAFSSSKSSSSSLEVGASVKQNITYGESS
jgi:PBP1b-binding outer membrane lipoprotein LpoB